VILLDSSVWIDHIRQPEPGVAAALADGKVIQHPFVTAEISLGSIKDRLRMVTMLEALPAARVVGTGGWWRWVGEAGRQGGGLGGVEALLRACASDWGGPRLWTRDKRLLAQAERLGLGYIP